MAKEFEFMDEEIALQQRPLGNYADALGKSYKDLEDRLRSEQGGGGFWSDLGKNFLQAAVVQPLAEQATEAVSGVINDPFKENNLEFYEEKEQKEAARKYNNAYSSVDTLNTSEKARRDSGMTQLEWETSSPEVLKKFREAFKVRAAEEGWNAAAFTDAQIDGLTYDYRKQRAEKTVSLREEMIAASQGLRSKEDMVRFHETFNKRGKGIIGAAMNFIGRPIRGDFVDKAAQDFLKSEDLQNIVAFQELRKRYQETGDFEDMIGDVYGIDIEANSFGIAKEIKTIYKEISGETFKIKQVKKVNQRTGETETEETKIGGVINPNKEALNNVPTILSTIEKFNFSDEANAQLLKRLNTKYTDPNNDNVPLNININYISGNDSYNITTYNKMVQEVLSFAGNEENFVDFNKEIADDRRSQRNQLLRNATYLEQINALNTPKPSDPDLVKGWEESQQQARSNMQNYQTFLAESAKIEVGIRAGQITSQVINGTNTALPNYHKFEIAGRDSSNVPILRIVPIKKDEEGAGTDEEILKARRQYNEWKLGRRNPNLNQPIFGRKVSSVKVSPVVDDDTTDAADDTTVAPDDSSVVNTKPRVYRPSSSTTFNPRAANRLTPSDIGTYSRGTSQDVRSLLGRLADERDRKQKEIDRRNDPNFIAFGKKPNPDKLVADK